MTPQIITPEIIHSAFLQFYTNPIISEVLAPLPIWTISDPTSKMPINIRHLIDGCYPSCAHPDPVIGAKFKDERCLTTLHELTETIPAATNCAFVVNSDHGCLVLDIEKTCPPEVREKLLSTGALYSEKSLSGQGCHLILPLPRSFHTLPKAATKTVLKEKNGWYEILQNNHFVTLTRNPLSTPVPEVDEDAWDQLWLSLALPVAQKADIVRDFTLESRPTDPWYDSLLTELCYYARGYTKAPKDFNHDHSRYEWAYCAFIYERLMRMKALNPSIPLINDPHKSLHISDITLDDNAYAWLLYETLTHHIAPRPKHEEFRNDVPLLLNTASNFVTYIQAQED